MLESSLTNLVISNQITPYQATLILTAFHEASIGEALTAAIVLTYENIAFAAIVSLLANLMGLSVAQLWANEAYAMSLDGENESAIFAANLSRINYIIEKDLARPL